MRRAVYLLPLSLLACSSASFEVNAVADGAIVEDGAVPALDGAPSSDEGGAPDSIPPETVADTASDVTTPTPTPDASAPDTAVVEAGCTTPGPNEDLFVAASAAGATMNGSAGCPFKTIGASLAADKASASTAARTVHVAGRTAADPQLYVEGALKLRSGLTLKSDQGPFSVLLQAAGAADAACANEATVVVEQGATLQGFVVDAARTWDAVCVPNRGTGVARILGTRVTRGEKAGLRVVGVAEANGLEAIENVVDGILIDAGSLTVGNGGGVRNVASNNGTGSTTAGNGVCVNGGLLSLAHADVKGNTVYGVRITSQAVGVHLLDDADLQANKSGGVYFQQWSSLKVRNSKILLNRLGIWGAGGASNTLDLGKPGDPGNNVFAGAAGKNDFAAVCVQTMRADATSVAADGNIWSACPLAFTSPPAGCTFSSSAAYVDFLVGWASGTTSGTVTATACTKG